jgi:hypothetical protein
MSNINTEFNLLSMANHNEGIQESSIDVSSQQYFSSFTKDERKPPWQDLYNDCTISPDPLAKMATIDNSCFWLVDF